MTSNLEAEVLQTVGGDLHFYVTDLVKRLGERKAELDWRPTVDGERWQFQGHGGEWVSFPVSRNYLVCVWFSLSQVLFSLKDVE